MSSEVKINTSHSILKKRVLLNIVWGLGLAVTLLIYCLLLRSPVASDIFLTNRWDKDLLLIIIPFVIFQGVVHWFTLRHLFPDKRVGNIIWVLVMSFLFLFAYALLLAELFARALESSLR